MTSEFEQGRRKAIELAKKEFNEEMKRVRARRRAKGHRGGQPGDMLAETREVINNLNARKGRNGKKL